jgi:hypothetical protein
MTLYSFLLSTYEWAERVAWVLLLAAVGVPLAGMVAARIGRGGRTDEDGRMIASAVIALGMVALLLEVAGIAIAVSVFNGSVLNADVMLLAAGPVAFITSLLAMRMVFPLREIGAVRTLVDGFFFAVACAFVVWLFSKFRGWGIVFFGSFTQLIVIAVLGFFLLRRLFLRALGGGRSRPPAASATQGWPER